MEDKKLSDKVLIKLTKRNEDYTGDKSDRTVCLIRDEMECIIGNGPEYDKQKGDRDSTGLSCLQHCKEIDEKEEIIAGSSPSINEAACSPLDSIEAASSAQASLERSSTLGSGSYAGQLSGFRKDSIYFVSNQILINSEAFEDHSVMSYGDENEDTGIGKSIIKGRVCEISNSVDKKATAIEHGNEEVEVDGEFGGKNVELDDDIVDFENLGEIDADEENNFIFETESKRSLGYNEQDNIIDKGNFLDRLKSSNLMYKDTDNFNIKRRRCEFTGSGDCSSEKSVTDAADLAEKQNKNCLLANHRSINLESYYVKTSKVDFTGDNSCFIVNNISDTGYNMSRENESCSIGSNVIDRQDMNRSVVLTEQADLKPFLKDKNSSNDANYKDYHPNNDLQAHSFLKQASTTAHEANIITSKTTSTSKIESSNSQNKTTNNITKISSPSPSKPPYSETSINSLSSPTKSKVNCRQDSNQFCQVNQFKENINLLADKTINQNINFEYEGPIKYMRSEERVCEADFLPVFNTKNTDQTIKDASREQIKDSKSTALIFDPTNKNASIVDGNNGSLCGEDFTATEINSVSGSLEEFDKKGSIYDVNVTYQNAVDFIDRLENGTDFKGEYVHEQNIGSANMNSGNMYKNTGRQLYSPEEIAKSSPFELAKKQHLALTRSASINNRLQHSTLSAYQNLGDTKLSHKNPPNNSPDQNFNFLNHSNQNNAFFLSHNKMDYNPKNPKQYQKTKRNTNMSAKLMGMNDTFLSNRSINHDFVNNNPSFIANVRARTANEMVGEKDLRAKHNNIEGIYNGSNTGLISQEGYGMNNVNMRSNVIEMNQRGGGAMQNRRGNQAQPAFNNEQGYKNTYQGYNSMAYMKSSYNAQSCNTNNAMNQNQPASSYIGNGYNNVNYFNTGQGNVNYTNDTQNMYRQNTIKKNSFQGYYNEKDIEQINLYNQTKIGGNPNVSINIRNNGAIRKKSPLNNGYVSAVNLKNVTNTDLRVFNNTNPNSTFPGNNINTFNNTSNANFTAFNGGNVNSTNMNNANSANFGKFRSGNIKGPNVNSSDSFNVKNVGSFTNSNISSANYSTINSSNYNNVNFGNISTNNANKANISTQHNSNSPDGVNRGMDDVINMHIKNVNSGNNLVNKSITNNAVFDGNLTLQKSSTEKLKSELSNDLYNSEIRAGQNTAKTTSISSIQQRVTSNNLFKSSLITNKGQSSCSSTTGISVDSSKATSTNLDNVDDDAVKYYRQYILQSNLKELQLSPEAKNAVRRSFEVNSALLDEIEPLFAVGNTVENAKYAFLHRMLMMQKEAMEKGVYFMNYECVNKMAKDLEEFKNMNNESETNINKGIGSESNLNNAELQPNLNNSIYDEGKNGIVWAVKTIQGNFKSDQTPALNLEGGNINEEDEWEAISEFDETFDGL